MERGRSLMTTLEESVAQLKQRLRSIAIDGRTYYLAEGDLVLTEERLATYVDGGQANAPLPPDLRRDELVGILRNGKIVRWKPGLILSYTIVRSTFSEASYKLVRGAMQRATAAWSEICGVTFRHELERDGGDGS